MIPQTKYKMMSILFVTAEWWVAMEWCCVLWEGMVRRESQRTASKVARAVIRLIILIAPCCGCELEEGRSERQP